MTTPGVFLICDDVNQCVPHWTARLHAALARAGMACDYVCLDHREEAGLVPCGKLADILARKPRFLYCVNRRPALDAINGGAMRDFFAACDFPVVIHIADHPAHHQWLLRPLPARWLAALVDTAHAPFFSVMGLQPQAVFTLHGGGERVDGTVEGRQPRGPHERDIDLLFCGDLAPEETVIDLLARLPVKNPALTRVVHAVLGATLEDAGQQDVFALFIDRARSHSMPPMANYLVMGVVEYLDHYVRNYRRRKLLRSFTRLALHVIGEIADPILADRGNVVRHGRKAQPAVNAWLARAKIALGDNITFVRGAHWRVFNALEHGCAVSVSPNDFMRQHFVDGESAVFIAPGIGVEDCMASYLAKPDRLAAVAAGGMAELNARHTWDHRARDLAAAVAAIESRP